MKKRTSKELRERREIEEALARLQPLRGDPVVDAAVACLRWILKEAEWREVWTELEERYGGPPAAHDPAVGEP